MTTYTNPTGNFSATEGDDTIIFNLAPSGTVTIDALGGNDGLLVNFSNPDALGFDVSDPLNTGSFNIAISGGFPGPRFFGYRFESVDLHGTAGDDSFSLQVRPNDSNLSVAFDGGAGNNRLHLDWTALTTGQSLILSGSTITTSLGAFANFGTFIIMAGSGSDTITMGSADDIIAGGGGNDTITAGEGVNNVSGGAGDDTISAGAGNDTLSGNAGNDVINGGDGSDTIYGDDDTFSAVTDGADRIDGGTGNDRIYGGGGNDTLYGGDGNDSLTGGKGADYLEGGAGNDSLDGFGDYYGSEDNLPDVLIAGAGDDSLTAGYGDTVDGGSGTDSLSLDLSAGSTGLNVDFRQLTSGATLTIGGASIGGIEFLSRVSGTRFDDVLVAGAVQGVNGINLNGGDGNDDLTGSTGVDWIYGGTGNDILRGGIGRDPNVSPGADRLFGDDGDDTFYIGSDGAYVYGGNGNDVIHGGSGNDDLSGDAGDDWISGGAGIDGLRGGAGNDTYIDTAANFSGDVIDKIETGDKIIILDANIAYFSFNLTGYTLTYSGGSLRFNSTVQGQLVATAAAGGGVQLTLHQPELVSIDTIASQLTTGYWSGATRHWPVTQGGTITVDISALNSSEQTLARAALSEWMDVIGVSFREVSGGGQITFDHSAGSNGAVAATNTTYANGVITAAQIQISTSWLTSYGNSLGSYGFQTYVHEVGHALGLGHPGNYNVDGAYYSDALFANDSWATSIMSYFDQQENQYFNNQNFSRTYALSPMQADILAAQSLYGLSTSTRTGDTVYGFHSNAGGIYDGNANPGGAFTIFDNGGNDTIDMSGTISNVRLNLNAETFSNAYGSIGNLSISRGVIIENAIGGSGADTLIGNAVSNVLTGGLGYDILVGGAQLDTFRDTAAGLNGDTITDFARGELIVITDAAPGQFLGWSNGQLTYGSTSITLSNLNNASITAAAAPQGGVQIFYGGPAIVVAGGSSVPAAQQPGGAKAETFASYEYPLTLDHPASSGSPLIPWADGNQAFDLF